MKDRILRYLNDFSKGNENDLAEEIRVELQMTPDELKRKSAQVLSAILHHYSQFAVSTIDAFFQRVIRSFTREAGLLGNFRLEVENELVLAEVVDALMDELGSNEELTEWVIAFSRERLLEGENWNVVAALNSFAREIFNEEFQSIEDLLEKPSGGANPYKATKDVLLREVGIFKEFMRSRAQEALTLLDQHGITADDFNYRDQGTAYKYFVEFANGRYHDSSKARIQSAVASAKAWASKKSRRQLELTNLADTQLVPLLQEMVTYDKLNGEKYRSVLEVLKNFYAFGLIADITRKLKVYNEENNLMLLSDAPKFLHGVIDKSDTPFIYEKVGSYFHNYLIDEFQDTSGFQWKNFRPLLKEAVDQNQRSLVVGDVKQSIYRWRGGDQQLLQDEVAKAMGDAATETKELNRNYRSAERIVHFNNLLFAKASEIVSTAVEDGAASQAFQDVRQQTYRFPGKGYVKINFIPKPGDERDWTDVVTAQIPTLIESLQDQGIGLRDIAILVRKNEEGQRIASELLRYKNFHAKEGYRYDVVSNESLRLETASSVNLLLTALRYLVNPSDSIVRAQLAYEVLKGEKLDQVFLESGHEALRSILPEEFLKQTGWLAKLSIFELTEELIRIFGLAKEVSELTYLQAFQDAVLEFSAVEKNDLPSFLDWWEKVRNKKSIQVAAHADAINVLTIHKAKGLQFKFVIIPYLNWRLNHEVPPLLWVHAEQPPFDQMGYLAVRYSGNLEGTYFKDDYLREKSKTYVDNLNLLYVAFTRAEEGLIAFSGQVDERKEKPAHVGELVHQALSNEPGLGSQLTDEGFEVGVLEKLETAEPISAFLPTSLAQYASFDWRKKLVIKREGSEFFLPSTTTARASINHGILLHRLLSHIHHQQDVPAALRQLQAQNTITQQERDVVEAQLLRMMEHPVVSGWFAREWTVLTEVPALIPGGKQSRLDRVMLGKKKTLVVDFKTGIKRQEDRAQVENYAGLLSQMGYPNVEGYLLYLDDLDVVEIISGSTLSLF